MRHLSPQTMPSSPFQAGIPSPQVISSEVAPAIAILTTQINLLQAQLHTMQYRLDELETMANPINRRYRAPEPENTNYSPIVKLSFKAMKLLFLFLVGFALVYIIAGSLGASPVTEVLRILISVWLMPLAAMTFCIVALASIVESLK
ncbi:hypothetical protein [Phormidesmis priestleyi]|nr:hypothetical protein [Phormidesmis priestleyi]